MNFKIPNTYYQLQISKILKRFFRVVLFVLSLPVIYVLIALILGWITVNVSKENKEPKIKTVYLHSNGVHLDIAFNKDEMPKELLYGIFHTENEQYLSFGWGDENFYLNTPTWGDLTAKTAFSALFLQSSSLMHITRYEQIQSDWNQIELTENQFNNLTNYIQKTFELDANQQKQILEESYGNDDNFYKANGSYSLFKTCNTWVNSGFKQSEIKACLWTPFDFALLNKFE